jgi:hypothetical protein
VSNILIKVTDNDTGEAREYTVDKEEFEKAKKAYKNNGFSITFTTIDGMKSTQFPCLSKIEEIELHLEDL